PSAAKHRIRRDRTLLYTAFAGNRAIPEDSLLPVVSRPHRFEAVPGPVPGNSDNRELPLWIASLWYVLRPPTSASSAVQRCRLRTKPGFVALLRISRPVPHCGKS